MITVDNPDVLDILRIVAHNIERRAFIAKIETTVLCGDLLAHINRCAGQIERRARERLRRG